MLKILADTSTTQKLRHFLSLLTMLKKRTLLHMKTDSFLRMNSLHYLSTREKRVRQTLTICLADRNNKIYLFVRKNKDDKETKEFYFFGEINAHGNPTEVRMPESNDTAFEIQYKLETPVRADIFEYITAG